MNKLDLVFIRLKSVFNLQKLLLFLLLGCSSTPQIPPLGSAIAGLAVAKATYDYATMSEVEKQNRDVQNFRKNIKYLISEIILKRIKNDTSACVKLDAKTDVINFKINFKFDKENSIFLISKMKFYTKSNEIFKCLDALNKDKYKHEIANKEYANIVNCDYSVAGELFPEMSGVMTELNSNFKMDLYK